MIAARRRAFEPAGQACDDGNVCTANSTCDGAGVCTVVGLLDMVPCDDRNACTTADTCVAAVRGPGAVAVRPRRLTSDVPLTSQDCRDCPLHDLTTSGINLESHPAYT